MRLDSKRKRAVFAIAIIVQLAILVAIPKDEIFARMRGRMITLETRPIDPYNVLSGYSVTLAYAIERVEPALVEKGLEQGGPAYFTVEAASPAWKLVSVTKARPEAMPNRTTIKGTYWAWGSSLKGADRLYIPEAEREKVADAMRATNGKAYVDLQVDDHGNVAVIRLRANGRAFGD
jgi:uncharacterized membrane-anchored protein